MVWSGHARNTNIPIFSGRLDIYEEITTMNLEKQRRKLLLLMEKAQNALSRQESKEILKKVKKVGKKMAGKSEI
jgi:hypothetical protein